jgi:F-type H+-transporting ATPase subunit gamma
MASLRAIRARIKSVKNTQKITKAMKMVAAAKLRRAQDAALRARPYAELIDDMLGQLSTSAEAPHALLTPRPVKKVEIVLLTSDRGLCGGFNSNVVRRLQRFLVDHKDQYAKISVSTIGRRGRDFAKKRGITIRKDYPGMLGRLQYSQAQHVADELVTQFTSGEADAVFLLYNRFQSALVQKVTLVPLLPIQPATLKADGAKAEGGKAPAGVKLSSDFIFEPSKDGLLKALLPKHLGVQIWQSMLESEASEHGARMTAMDSATKNAKEMIARLTLQYNRARQAAITKELMEIVSGAEALK